MEKYTVVIGPKGVGGWKSPDEKLWTSSVDYIAYRTHGAFIKEAGRISIKTDDERLKQLRELLPVYSVAVVTGVKEKDHITLQNISDILESKITNNAEANAILEEAQRPVTFTDEILGEFALDKSIDLFYGSINAGKLNIAVSIDTKEDVVTARELCSDVQKLIKDASAYAAKWLTELANDWAQDEYEITEESFAARITLETISVSSDGEFALWFDDGELFLGHSICVEGSLEEGFTDVGIHG